ncbi:aldo/keto reductase [Gryllotalpicola reticulitermitis]|uniref:Aldo/keto reductase n=1 Tax=Gryllotalpicola reticulitermitis TaxID=1184153 RepID=A0ABV8Q9Z5_9MICO
MTVQRPTASTETFVFTTHLRQGRERDYERVHHAIPADLDAAMRAAGVIGWRISRSGLTLTHEVEARSRTEMERRLDADPANVNWQRQVAPFLDPSATTNEGGPAGTVIWDFSWPATPRLALGCAQLGNLYHERSDVAAWALLDAAWAAGVRHFDTAPHYGLGLSERRLGEFLRTKPRSAFTVSTKVGRMLVPNPGGANQIDDEGFVVPATLRREWDFSADGVRASLEASLERLGLDHVDTVLIHDPNDHANTAIAAAAPTLLRLRDEGVVESVGVGNRDTALLTRFVRDTGIDVVMLAGRYTLLDQSALDELLPTCLHQGVAVLNAAVFNSGVLAERRPSDDAHFEYDVAPTAVVERAREIARLCERHDTSLPAAALAFSGAHPAVRELVVGADNEQQVRRNAELLASPPPPKFWGELVGHGLIRADAPLPAAA